jgi:hypothetical protein
MKTAYIIEYDNGQSYEDHSSSVISVAMTQPDATREVARLSTWIENKIKQAPPSPDMDLPDEEYLRQHDLRNEWLAKLKCPHGANCLRDAVRERCGSVRFYSVPLLP